MMNCDYQKLYNEERKLREDIEAQFVEYRESSKEIEELLESELNENTTSLKKKEEEFKELKEKNSQIKSDQDKLIRRLERESESLRLKNEELLEINKKDRQKLVQLENDAECLENQNRVLESLNSDLEQKIDSILEELALLQTELEENRKSHQNDIENIERLKQYIKDTESEQFAQQMKQKILGDNQENNSLLQNHRNSKQQGLSIASTASNVSNNKFNVDVNNIVLPQMINFESQGMEELLAARKAKRIRHGTQQNLTYSFNQDQIDSLSQLYKEDQKLQLSKQNFSSNFEIVQTSPQISEKDTSTSNSSSGNKDESQINNCGAIEDKNLCLVQRGRKYTSFSGKQQERYSEERKLQQKIMKDKISIYDKNINSLKLTDLKFIKSLDFVSNLIKDLGDKMGNLKSKKAMLVTPRNNQNKMIF